MKIGIADYGYNMWDGGECFDQAERWRQLKEIGYEGVERVTALTGEHAVQLAAGMKRLGMDFGTVRAPNQELSIQWTSAFGKSYIWTFVNGDNYADFSRQARIQAAACARYGISTALHNHMGTPVETQEQLEQFLADCPDNKLVLDTAHLAAMGGDAVEIASKYTDRIAALHLKDWIMTDSDHSNWTKRGRFCELGAGNIGLDNIEVLRTALRGGFDGWVFVEQDSHLQEPLLDLTISRQYLRKAGY
ncbi:sugar phosphate isomerase/epimerase family protein [Paenibacillus sp. GCM10027626]|uniref:sugar phosphate isomerase/epimerase family protein n=1 Tax=Paenibacillus sp. GCM10027626 TaxID=3273411 RepID=UPI003625BD32